MFKVLVNGFLHKYLARGTFLLSFNPRCFLIADSICDVVHSVVCAQNTLWSIRDISNKVITLYGLCESYRIKCYTLWSVRVLLNYVYKCHRIMKETFVFNRFPNDYHYVLSIMFQICHYRSGIKIISALGVSALYFRQ